MILEVSIKLTRDILYCTVSHLYNTAATSRTVTRFYEAPDLQYYIEIHWYTAIVVLNVFILKYHGLYNVFSKHNSKYLHDIQ